MKPKELHSLSDPLDTVSIVQIDEFQLPTDDLYVDALQKAYKLGCQKMTKKNASPKTSVIFCDKDNNSISPESWIKRHEDKSNSLVRISKIGDVLVITEWVGIQVGFVRHMFRTSALHLITQVPIGQPSWSGSLTQAKTTHVMIEKQAAANLQTSTLPACPICAMQMVPRYGRWGLFYGCPNWAKSKCPGKRNADGTLTKDVAHLIVEKEKLEVKQKQAEEKTKKEFQLETDGPWSILEIE
jgi:hypothetical protein